jgi:DNA-binding CsgD family transcriptional regulator
MKDSWSKYLSKGDLLHLLEIVNWCLECDSIDSFTNLLCNLKKIVGFDAAICTCAEPSRLPASLDKVVRPVNHHCPKNLMDDHMDMWRYERCYKVDVPVQVILSSLDLQDTFSTVRRFVDGRLQIAIPQSNGHRLTDGWVYGAYEKSCNRWILFVFACFRHINDPRSSIAIELVIPHLLHTFRGLRYLCSAQPFNLTKREYEVLNWIKTGKTTWEISKILAISESCVNFHIDNLKKKLHSVNRTQAAVVAVGNGLIKI